MMYGKELYEELTMGKVLIVASNYPRAKWEAGERNLPDREWTYGDPHAPERSAGITVREVVFIDGWDRDISKQKGSEVRFYFNSLQRAKTGYQDN
jgi:hypothetical protein